MTTKSELVDRAWQGYFDACYGHQSVSKTQVQECRQAFYSGVAVALELMGKIVAQTGYDDDKAALDLQAMHDETGDWLEAHAVSLRNAMKK